MMKRFWVAAAWAVSVLSFGAVSNVAPDLGMVSTASAAEADQTFTGKWYDKDGHFVVNIQPGVINSCRIVRTYGITNTNPGSGHYVILEANGEHDMFIQWEGGYWENNTYVEPHISIDGGEKLSRKA